jgi:hypothetical protein
VSDSQPYFLVTSDALWYRSAFQDVTLTYEDNAAKIVSIDSPVPATKTTLTNITFPTDIENSLAFSNVGLDNPVWTFETNSSLAIDSVFQMIIFKNSSTPLATFLDPVALHTAVQEVFTAYGAIYGTLNLRLPIAAASQIPQQVVINYLQARIVQAVTPTRILQALLTCILAFGCLTAAVVRKTNNVLTKPPYSIGATMGLIADSAFVELKGLRGVRTEAELERVLEPYKFEIGWGPNPKGGTRFGVDIVPK